MVSEIRSETSRPASRRACWTCADQVAGQALGGELGRDLGVEDDEAAAAQHPGRGVGVGGAGDGLEGVLPLLQRQPAGGDGAVLGDRPVAGLRALDRELHVLAQPRTGGAGVDGELLLDAVRRRLVGVGREQPDLLDVDLVADDRLEAGQRGRVVDDDGQRRQRQPVAQVARPCAARTPRSRPRGPGPSRRPGRRRPAARRPAASRPGAPSGRRSARARPPRSSAASAAPSPGRRPRAPCRACRRRPGCRPRSGPASAGCTSWSARRGTTGSRRTRRRRRTRRATSSSPRRSRGTWPAGSGPAGRWRRSTPTRRTPAPRRRRWRRAGRSTSCSTAGSAPGAPSRGCPAR